MIGGAAGARSAEAGPIRGEVVSGGERRKTGRGGATHSVQRPDDGGLAVDHGGAARSRRRAELGAALRRVRDERERADSGARRSARGQELGRRARSPPALRSSSAGAAARRARGSPSPPSSFPRQDQAAPPFAASFLLEGAQHAAVRVEKTNCVCRCSDFVISPRATPAPGSRLQDLEEVVLLEAGLLADEVFRRRDNVLVLHHLELEQPAQRVAGAGRLVAVEDVEKDAPRSISCVVFR